MTVETLVTILAVPAGALAWWLVQRGKEVGAMVEAVNAIAKSVARIEAVQTIESSKTLQVQLDVASMKGERRAEDRFPRSGAHPAE